MSGCVDTAQAGRQQGANTRLYKFWYGRNFYIVIDKSGAVKVYTVERRKFDDGYHYVLVPLAVEPPQDVRELSALIGAARREQLKEVGVL